MSWGCSASVGVPFATKQGPRPDANAPRGQLRAVGSVVATVGGEGSDFAFELRMHKFAVAIATFDPAAILGDLQPDTRMPKRAFAAVTGHTPSVHNAGFGRWKGHEAGPWIRQKLPLVMTKAAVRGKGSARE